MNQLAEHDDDSISRVVVDLSELGRVDYTGVLELKGFLDDCRTAGLEAKLRDIPDHAIGTLTRALGDELSKHFAKCNRIENQKRRVLVLRVVQSFSSSSGSGSGSTVTKISRP